MSEMRRNKPYDMFGIRLHSDSNVKIDARELYLLKRLGIKVTQGASLVAQWLRIRLPRQGTRVRALVWEDPTCRGATGPVSHNY